MINKHLIGILPEDLAAAGYNPAQQIVPAWFGFCTQITVVPEQCMIQITGCSQFKLFVNGCSLLFGPCRSAKEIIYYDTLDIAPYLKCGENRIQIQVFSYPENPPIGHPEAQGPNYCYGDNRGPAIALEGTIGDTDPADPSSWRVWLDKGQGFNAHDIFLLGANETVDGTQSLPNPLFQDIWKEEDLLKATYVQTMTYDPFGTRRGSILEPRPIPLLYRKEKQIPDWTERTIAPHSQESHVIDAGELTTAYFRIGFRGGRGSKVRLTYAESYYQKREDGSLYKGIRDDRSGIIQGIYDEYTVGDDTIYEPFRFRTFRFIQISVETAGEPLTILPQPYIETAYPLRNVKKPVFTDPRKEKLYDVAFRTLQLCAHDTYEDCPYYEQLMYACDTRLEMLFTYAATDDLELPRQAIRLFGSSLQNNGLTQSRFPSQADQIIPVFALYFVLMLDDYVQHTGDLDFIRPYIPTAERIIETFLNHRCESGLLAPHGYWDFFDWTPEWSATRLDNTPTAVLDGESALQNLFFIYAAQSLIRLLPQYHRKDLADYYESECMKLQQLIEQSCYVPEKGLYKEGPRTDEYTQHTQIFAVLTGLVKGEKAKAIMEKVLTDKSLIPCSFMQNFYLFRALEKTDMYDRTEDAWDTWYEFLDLHCTTFPETPFDPRSDCHAWSSLPLYEF